MDENLLQVKHLNVCYKKAQILLDVSLDVKGGEIVAIAGESGSGKTTLLRAISNMLYSGGAITSGEILFKNIDLTKLSHREWKNIYGKQMGFTFQDPGKTFDPIRKIGSQFTEVLKSNTKWKKKEIEKRQLAILRRFNIDDPERILSSYAFQLSGGLKQRTAIAMAMAVSPSILLADEPTSALDVTTQKQIALELKQLKEISGSSILFVTHNLRLAAFLADRIGIMHHGMLVEFGETEKILKNPANDYTRSLIHSLEELERIS